MRKLETDTHHNKYDIHCFNYIFVVLRSVIKRGNRSRRSMLTRFNRLCGDAIIWFFFILSKLDFSLIYTFVCEASCKFQAHNASATKRVSCGEAFF